MADDPAGTASPTLEPVDYDPWALTPVDHNPFENPETNEHAVKEYIKSLDASKPHGATYAYEPNNANPRNPLSLDTSEDIERTRDNK